MDFTVVQVFENLHVAFGNPLRFIIPDLSIMKPSHFIGFLSFMEHFGVGKCAKLGVCDKDMHVSQADTPPLKDLQSPYFS